MENVKINEKGIILKKFSKNSVASASKTMPNGFQQIFEHFHCDFFSPFFSTQFVSGLHNFSQIS
jgi:hypothetical protein